MIRIDMDDTSLLYNYLKKKIDGDITVVWVKSEHLKSLPQHTVRYRVGSGDMLTLNVGYKELLNGN